MGVYRLAVAAALLVVLAVAPSAHAADATRTLELALPAGAGAGTEWRTPPLTAAGGFDVVGAEWRSREGARVELRARRAGGGWTRWVRVVAGEPVWSGRAGAVQLRGARAVRPLRVHAVAVGGADAAGAAGAARTATAGARAAGPGGRPAIVPRSAWDPQDRCRPRVGARYGRIDFAVVHHTESLAFYAPEQSAAVVLGICLFHRDGNRWNDIGYDLLVDRYGTVFEGRAGGVEQPVIGAQAGGWNAVSTGIAMIGSYSVAPPPTAALDALEQVLAWKLSLAGLPATGAVRERSIGGDVNAHPPGALVRFRRISGHRDADLTDCPGGALYALLPRIRRDVAALLPPPRELLTLNPVGAPVEPAPLWLTGRLARAGGRRPAGVAVRVEQQGADGAWREVAATRTGADGIWSATPALSESGPLRAVAAGDGGAAEIASQVVQARVRAAVALRATPVRVRRGGTLRIAGTSTPPKGSVRVRVERRTPTGAYRRALVRDLAAPGGRFALSARLHRPGVYRVFATTRADARNAAGLSRVAAVRVLKRR